MKVCLVCINKYFNNNAPKHIVENWAYISIGMCDICIKKATVSEIDNKTIFDSLMSIKNTSPIENSGEKQTGRKPFDLDRAIAGDAMVTRSGKKVLLFAHFPNCIDWEVVVQIEGEERIVSMPKTGKYKDGAGLDETHEFDLFMVAKERTVWVNLYENGVAYQHDSEERANHCADIRNRMRIGNKAHPITIIE